jgi:hypothetical protein
MRTLSRYGLTYLVQEDGVCWIKSFEFYLLTCVWNSVLNIKFLLHFALFSEGKVFPVLN